MLLVVDVGNTQTHFGAFRGEELLEHWRFATVRQSTADQLGAALRNLLELRGYALRGPRRLDRLLDRARSSSPSGRRWPSATSATRCSSSGPGTKTGMAIRYDNPREIGADRLVNAVALRERFGGPAVCVDFGTATTFDVVSREGEYLGGSLMTGIEISLEALSERGARLPKVDLAPPQERDRQEHDRRDPLGRRVRLRRRDRRDPAPPLRRARRARRRRSPRAGSRSLVVPYTEEIEEVDDLLTLTGLRLLHERNALSSARPRCGRHGATPRRSPRPTPGRSGRCACPTACCSRRWPGSATGSCACRPSATAPGMAVSEMVSSHAIHYRNERTCAEMLRIDPRERAGGPVSIQLFGEDPAMMRSAAALVAARGRRRDRHQHGLPGAEGAARPAPAPRCSPTPTAPSRSRARPSRARREARRGCRSPSSCARACAPARRAASSSPTGSSTEAGVAAIAFHPRSAAVQHKGVPDYELAARARRSRCPRR